MNMPLNRCMELFAKIKLVGKKSKYVEHISYFLFSPYLKQGMQCKFKKNAAYFRTHFWKLAGARARAELKNLPLGFSQQKEKCCVYNLRSLGILIILQEIILSWGKTITPFGVVIATFLADLIELTGLEGFDNHFGIFPAYCSRDVIASWSG